MLAAPGSVCSGTKALLTPTSVPNSLVRESGLGQTRDLSIPAIQANTSCDNSQKREFQRSQLMPKMPLSVCLCRGGQDWLHSVGGPEPTENCGSLNFKMAMSRASNVHGPF